MTRGIETLTRHGWAPVEAVTPPRVPETDTIVLRGLEPGATVRIGPQEVTADDSGGLELRPATDELLGGHVGLVAVSVSGKPCGEIELVPGKLSEDAYNALRAELQRTWTDLVLDPAGVTAVRAGIPPARELWRRIDEPLAQVLDRPNELLRVGTAPRRLERVRHRRELEPGVVRAAARGAAALTRTLQRTTDTPENHLAGATLQLLRNHARRDPSAVDLVERIDTLLRHPVLARSRGSIRRVTWGMRSDRRYRQLLEVYRILNRPELAATEGPGELRLGVPALPRLYEYWVFLRVLLASLERYGRPEGSAFDALAVKLPGRRRRLELPPGTTVTFPGPVHVAFEPRITARGDGWMGLEYVPHPDTERQQLVATPDVVVFRPGSSPWATIIDAKYVGRHFVESDAAKTHEKYARMRWKGTPVVRNVLIAHPHAGFANHWAGYGHVAMTPGLPAPSLPLPLPVERHPTPAQPPLEHPTGPASIVADQYWMHQWLQGRRIELGALRSLVAEARAVRSTEIVMPRIAQLVTFAAAAEARGWTVHWIETTKRWEQIELLIELIASRWADGPVIVVSGDPALVGRLPEGVEVFDDLARAPLL